ncbi:MAG TPA: nitrilase, partial [Aliiroseovarius sp.]|nr:nitrilase [Aliiroseovarius sp.]
MTIIKGAVVQTASVLFDTQRTLEKLADLTRDAAATGARLIVFPEAFVGGYPKGLDFGARLGMRSPEGRDMYRRYYDAAIAVPGPETALMGEAAAAANAHMVVG